MYPNKFFTPNKIVVYVILFSASIIAALFITHLHQKPVTPELSAEDGTLFSVPREIKPFELVSDKNQAFKLNDLYNHWTLLFFGFTHCDSICPTTLTLLNRVYQKLKPSYPNLQVVLISLDPARDDEQTLARYMQSFNPNFIGVSGKIQELRKLQSQLGVFSARSGSGSNYQIQHTSSIYLVNPKGAWVGFFHFGLSAERLSQAFISSVKSYA